jgi:hypothetical protein
MDDDETQRSYGDNGGDTGELIGSVQQSEGQTGPMGKWGALFGF